MHDSFFSFVNPFPHTPRSHLFERETRTSQPLPIMKNCKQSATTILWQENKLQLPNHAKKPLPRGFIGLLWGGLGSFGNFPLGLLCELDSSMRWSRVLADCHCTSFNEYRVTFACKTGVVTQFNQLLSCSRCGVASVMQPVWCGYTFDLDRLSRFMRQGLHPECIFREVKSKSGLSRRVYTNVMKQGNDLVLSMNGICFVICWEVVCRERRLSKWEIVWFEVCIE